jgi:hypothetical protein
MQAAMGLLPLDLVLRTITPQAAGFEDYKAWGQAINLTAVLGVVIATLLSSAGIGLLAPRLRQVCILCSLFA